MFLYNVLQLFFVHSAIIVSINQVTNRPTLPFYADIAGNDTTANDIPTIQGRYIDWD